MNPTIDAITICVADLEVGRHFYERGLGLAAEEDGDESVNIRLGPEATVLQLQPWEVLARELDSPGRGRGFRGFTFSYIVEQAEGVDELLTRVAKAGARPPSRRTTPFGATAPTSPIPTATCGRWPPQSGDRFSGARPPIPGPAPR